MFVYQLRDPAMRTVKVSVDAKEGHQDAPVVYDGAPAAVERIKDTLCLTPGVGGRNVGDITSPHNLYAAMQQPAVKKFGPRLLSGHAIVGKMPE